jgi:hypothetical protein
MNQTFREWAIYIFAGIYVIALTYGWLFFEPPKVTTGDYFTQFGLILAALGFYRAEPPKK